MPNHPLFLAAAVAHGVLSLGHTTKGIEQFKHPSLKQVPALLRSTVQAGWYEGSLFFAIVAVLNYKWSSTGLVDGPDKVLAGLVTSLLFGFGANYFRAGDKPTAVTLAIVGVIQALGAKRAAL
ncbi:hypothetical protein K505DRAFT_403926 [Melanomma pulvis-pyrius CBS 109.77]|uniref:Integral membrane protein n=1 Tax=Melanomma pulvis-pyrius CBS 109.77 TaxID=1314802 RepID=A0A6A6XWF8_9PLEO|nr:hypothetical protein K505DRAFT_403926 [Melanomma pulvis-pyrius CBS 109.77]